MNNENLKVLSPTEARELGSRGGKASGEARRNRRKIKDLAAILAQCPATGEAAETLTELGVAEEDQTTIAAILATQYKKALQGDTKAATFFLDCIREKEEEEGGFNFGYKDIYTYLVGLD